MTPDQAVLTALKEFGIQYDIALEAAKRYGKVESAVEWCFGEGQQPQETESHPFAPQWEQDHGAVEHHEQLGSIGSSSSAATAHTAPRLPPRTARNAFSALTHHSGNAPPPPAPHSNTIAKLARSDRQHLSPPLPSQGTSTLPSNNPFRNNPPPPPQSTLDDEDEELQRAIRMSQEDQGGSGSTSMTTLTGSETVTVGGDDGIPNLGVGMGMDVDVEDEDARQRRERSVRATAPPPSPDPEEGEVMGTLFGPSSRDEDGRSILVPAKPQAPNPTTSTEDEELNRAIQDSLMTASFHSASAMQATERAVPMPRRPGAPLVFLSESGESTYAANALQAIYAVPQLREIIAKSLIPLDSADSTLCRDLRKLDELCRDDDESFVRSDELLNDIRSNFKPTQLPPTDVTKTFINDLEKLLSSWQRRSLSKQDPGIPLAIDPRADEEHSPFRSTIETVDNGSMHASFVNYNRSASIASELHAHLANILWRGEAPGQSIISLGDVLPVYVMWEYGAKRELWKLEERVVLDRYLLKNAAWSTQLRAQQNMAAGSARRYEQQIEDLTMFKASLAWDFGQSLLESLTTLIKHYDASPETDDAVQTDLRESMKAKLEKILAVLSRKVEVLKEDLAKEQKLSSGTLFDTEEPEHNEHVYILRAALYHDGAVVAGRHLYVYVRAEDGKWWKIQDHEISPVEWKDVAEDKTGIFMDGGPYLLLYSRDGPSAPKGSDADPPVPAAQPGMETDAVEDAVPPTGEGPADSAADAPVVGLLIDLE